MSLITRCPVCGTMFKVVPDQLRISDGWVRCGQCAEVFDASANLQAAEAVPPQATQAPPTPASSAPAASPPAPTPPAPTPSEIVTAAPLPAPAPSVVTAPAEAQDSIAAPPLYPWFPSEVRDSQLQKETVGAEPDLDEVSFVRSARRHAVWRRPMVRVALVLLIVVLGALQALQYAVQERDKLAAQRPALRPWLQLLCEPLRCQIGPPRQIDAIVIDSSSFSRLRGDAYRLNYTLRNQARMQIAMPSVELTLTDTQDQPVIRRVLAPADIGAAAVIAAASDASGSVAVSVAGDANSARIAGYRLLAFYP